MKLYHIMASVAAAALFIAVTSPASARPKKTNYTAQSTQSVSCVEQDRGLGCLRYGTAAQPGRQAKRQRSEATEARSDVVMLSHPVGCKRTLFCACGAAVDLWGGSGTQYRSLWPSEAWFRFARAAPAHNTVAVRHGHVMVLKSHVSGDTWIVNDYNSGGHLSRRHARSIRGYTIVDPERPRTASR